MIDVMFFSKPLINSISIFLFYSQADTPVPSASSSRVKDSINDIVKAAVENRDVGLKPQVQKEFEKSWNQKEPEDEPDIIDIPDDPPEPAGSSMFLPSSSSTSGMSLKILNF